MQHKIITVGALAVNCHLIMNENNGELIIVDPGADPEKIIEAAADMKLDTARIILTHGHFDHISAAGDVAEALHISTVELNSADFPLYLSDMNCYPPFYPRPVNLPEPTAIKPIANCRILDLPGHTQGGAGLLFNDNGKEFLLAGDTIFYASIGRTDLPGGNFEQLITTIKEQIMTLNDDVIIHCGHDEATTVGFERRNNPFIK